MVVVLVAGLLASVAGATLQADHAADRCDAAAFEATVGGMEDQAFSAMKAANQAIAAAARGGEVGAAGDAEWDEYKAWTLAIQRARVRGIGILGACNQTARALLAPTEPRATSLTLEATVESPHHGDRFRIGTALGYADLNTRSATTIPIVTQSGLYVVNSASPSGPIVVPGGFFQPGPSVTTGALRPRSRAFENNLNLSLSLAPDGYDRAGWNFSAEGGLSQGKLREQLSGPVSAGGAMINVTAPPAVSCLIISTFTGQCVRYGLAVPYTRAVFETPGAFNSPTQTQINTYDLRQLDNRYSVKVVADYAIPFSSPVGDLKASLGVELGAAWWSAKQVRTIGAWQEGPESAFVITVPSSADGPVFSAKSRLALSGKTTTQWPLEWSLFGSLGVDAAELTLHGVGGANALLHRARATSGYGATLAYELPWALRISLTLQEARTPFLQSWLAPGATQGGTGLGDPQGSRFDLREAGSRAYEVKVEKTF